MDWVIAHWDQIASIGALVIGWIIARPWCQAQLARAAAITAGTNANLAWNLAVSVAQRVYQDSVRYLKARGKWNDDTKKMVFENACSILKAEVKEHGLEIAQAVLPGLIQRAVMMLKNEGQSAAIPFSGGVPPLSASELQPELGTSIPGSP